MDRDLVARGKGFEPLTPDSKSRKSALNRRSQKCAGDRVEDSPVAPGARWWGNWI